MKTKNTRVFTYEDIRHALNLWLKEGGTPYKPIEGIKCSQDSGYIVEECNKSEEPPSAR